eukprot:8884810-Alexandrium_andersonii.AAC.1
MCIRDRLELSQCSVELSGALFKALQSSWELSGALGMSVWADWNSVERSSALHSSPERSRALR